MWNVCLCCRADVEATPENHTVLDSVSAIFDSSGGVLSSLSTGVSIHIPSGALPPGTTQEIYFKVCQQDSSVVDPSKGETVLSPLVMCGPHGLQFLKPVELRLPHSAAENPDSWNFSLKSSSEMGQGDWQSVNLSNLKTEGNTSTVSVMVDHF